jgi:hypothetical protein
MTSSSDLPGWPAASPRPARLDQLLAFLFAETSGDFADFQIHGLEDDPLVRLNPGDAEIMRPLSSMFGFFAQDGGGGGLALWLRSQNPSRCPVILFDSEGQRSVLGESLDDFLCLLAGRWVGDKYSELHADREFQAWVRKAGLTPHERPEARLEPLNRLTLEFQRWLAEEQRRIQSRVFPDLPLVIDIEPGQRVDVVRIGAPEAEVSSRLGTPRFASWEKASNPKMTAVYAGKPYTVVFDRSSRLAREVRIHADRVIARLPGDFEPLFATENDAVQWLRDRDPAARREGKTLSSSALGLSMSFGWGYGYYDSVQTRWVTAIAVCEPT